MYTKAEQRIIDLNLDSVKKVFKSKHPDIAILPSTLGGDSEGIKDYHHYSSVRGDLSQFVGQEIYVVRVDINDKTLAASALTKPTLVKVVRVTAQTHPEFFKKPYDYEHILLYKVDEKTGRVAKRPLWTEQGLQTWTIFRTFGAAHTKEKAQEIFDALVDIAKAQFEEHTQGQLNALNERIAKL